MNKFDGMRTHIWPQCQTDPISIGRYTKTQRDQMLRKYFGWDPLRPITEIYTGLNVMSLQPHNSDKHLPSYMTQKGYILGDKKGKRFN